MTALQIEALRAVQADAVRWLVRDVRDRTFYEYRTAEHRVITTQVKTLRKRGLIRWKKSRDRTGFDEEYFRGFCLTETGAAILREKGGE